MFVGRLLTNSGTCKHQFRYLCLTDVCAELPYLDALVFALKALNSIKNLLVVFKGFS